MSAWAYNSGTITAAKDVAIIENEFTFKASTNYTYISGEEQKSMAGVIILIVCGAGVVITPTTLIIVKICKRPRRGLLM